MCGGWLIKVVQLGFILYIYFVLEATESSELASDRMMPLAVLDGARQV